MTGQLPTAGTKPLGISVGSTQGTPTGLTLGTAPTTAPTGLPLGSTTSSSGFQFGGAKTTGTAPSLGGQISGTTSTATTTQASSLGFPLAAATTRCLTLNKMSFVVWQ